MYESLIERIASRISGKKDLSAQCLSRGHGLTYLKTSKAPFRTFSTMGL